MRTGHLLVAMLLLAAACGDDAGPSATPEERQAIADAIDAELSTDEERCVLDGLVASDISVRAVAEETLTGEQETELVSVAAACIDDLSRIPGFVEAFREAAAAEGTTMTEAEAVCAIRTLDAGDPAAALAECLGDTSADTAGDQATYGDDEVLDLLWDACESGNAQTCDELAATAPPGSGYLEFGRTCGGAVPDGAVSCFDELG
ncbi:MAG: hypothetical protein AAF548_08975 [Actinomycetota bacterium]